MEDDYENLIDIISGLFFSKYYSKQYNTILNTYMIGSFGSWRMSLDCPLLGTLSPPWVDKKKIEQFSLEGRKRKGPRNLVERCLFDYQF